MADPKEYKVNIGALKFTYYYDRSLKMWTIIMRDAIGNQIGNADYAPTKDIAKQLIQAAAEQIQNEENTEEERQAAKEEADAAEIKAAAKKENSKAKARKANKKKKPTVAANEPASEVEILSGAAKGKVGGGKKKTKGKAKSEEASGEKMPGTSMALFNPPKPPTVSGGVVGTEGPSLTGSIFDQASKPISTDAEEMAMDASGVFVPVSKVTSVTSAAKTQMTANAPKNISAGGGGNALVARRGVGFYDPFAGIPDAEYEILGEQAKLGAGPKKLKQPPMQNLLPSGEQKRIAAGPPGPKLLGAGEPPPINVRLVSVAPEVYDQLVQKLGGKPTASADESSTGKKDKEPKGEKLKSFSNILQSATLALASALLRMSAEVEKTSRILSTDWNDAAKILIQRVYESGKSFFNLGQRFVKLDELQQAQETFGQQFGGVMKTDAAAEMAATARQFNIMPAQLIAAVRPLSGILGGVDKATERFKGISRTFMTQGLTGKDASEFIAQNSNLIARNGDRFAGALTRAAIEAKKAGYSLQSIEGFGDSIVGDFETFLEDATAMAAMGIQFDVSSLAEAALSGDTERLKNELQSQLAAQGLTLENLNRAQRMQLEKVVRMPLEDALKIQKAPETAASVTVKLDMEAAKEQSKASDIMRRVATLFDFAAKGFAVAVGIFTLSNIRSAVRAPFGDKSGTLFGRKGGPGGGAAPGGTATPPAPGGTPAAGPGGTASQVSKFSMNDVLKGAAAMLIVAASIYVLAKALQEFKGVEWEQLGMAGAALAGLTVAIFALSKIPTAGLIKGATSMVIVSGAVYLLGKALQQFKDVGIGELGLLAGTLVLVGGGLALVGTLMTGPQLLGVLGFAAALGLVSLAMMGIAKAFEIASPGFSAFGGMIESFGNSIRTVFTGLGDIITSIGNAIAKVVGTAFDSLTKLVDTLSKADAGNVAWMGASLVSVAGGVTALAGATLVEGFANLGGSLLNRLSSFIAPESKPSTTASPSPTTTSSPTAPMMPTTDINADQATITENLARLINTLNATNQRMNEVANRLGNISFDVNLDGAKVGTGTMRARNVAAVNGAAR